MLNALKNLSLDRMAPEELVSLHSFGRQLRDEYERLQIEEPAWLDVNLKSLKREIVARNADALEARRVEVQSRLEALKTPGQRKAELLKELADIDKALKA